MQIISTNNGNLLCVANFKTSTGYAWDFIDGLFAGVSGGLYEKGVNTWVAYPRISTRPSAYDLCTVNLVEMTVDFTSIYSIWTLVKFIVQQNIRVIYLTDRTVCHPVYLILKLSGVRKIVVHDHTSGCRTIPSGLKFYFKWLTRRIPGIQADVVIGVSDFVKNRIINVSLVQSKRVKRIWNYVNITIYNDNICKLVRANFNIDLDSLILMCTCRATPEKGVATLLQAFDLLCYQIIRFGGTKLPALVYIGDGPFMCELRNIRSQLEFNNNVIFAGYRSDAKKMVAGADLCVVPSLWDEAFCLAALEPMVSGVPVVASRVGGIPEVVVDGETGILVTPGDERELANAMFKLVTDKNLMMSMGARGKKRAIDMFSKTDKINELTSILTPKN